MDDENAIHGVGNSLALPDLKGRHFALSRDGARPVDAGTLRASAGMIKVKPIAAYSKPMRSASATSQTRPQSSSDSPTAAEAMSLMRPIAT